MVDHVAERAVTVFGCHGVAIFPVVVRPVRRRDATRHCFYLPTQDRGGGFWARRSTCIIPTTNPSTAPTTVNQGRVGNQRSAQAPRSGGRANSRAMVVTREAQSMPTARDERDCGRPTNDPQALCLARLSGNPTFHRDQKRKEHPRGRPEPIGEPFIPGPNRVSTPQEDLFEKFFTKSVPAQ